MIIVLEDETYLNYKGETIKRVTNKTHLKHYKNIVYLSISNRFLVNLRVY